MRTLHLSVNQCPHGVYSVSIDGDRTGTRITPSKCCGRWDESQSWPLTEEMTRMIVSEIQCRDDEEAAF